MLKIQYGINDKQIPIANDRYGFIVDDGKGEAFIPNEWIAREEQRMNKPKTIWLTWYYRLIPHNEIVKIINELTRTN